MAVGSALNALLRSQPSLRSEHPKKEVVGLALGKRKATPYVVVVGKGFGRVACQLSQFWACPLPYRDAWTPEVAAAFGDLLGAYV